MLGRTLPRHHSSTVSRPLSTPPPSFDALGSEHLRALKLHALKTGPGGRPRSGVGTHVAPELLMLKLIGSYAIAKLLGFGLVGAIVIYVLLSLLT